MEFLKRHYEKIALSVVLLLLAGVAFWLKIGIAHAREDLQNSITTLPKPAEFQPVDLTTNATALERLKKPPVITLAAPHLVFSPMIWKQKSTGDLVKLTSSNPADALKVIKITPLKLIIAFDKVSGEGYWFTVTNQIAHKFPGHGEKKYMKPKEKNTQNKFFTLLEVKGSPEDPSEFTIELVDTKERATVGKNKPFEKVEGYASDLKFDLENKSFPDSRINSRLIFGGDTNNVIAITAEEVRVQANSNQKQTTLKSTNAPSLK
ncbi:MAG: hypothetical protein M3Y82_10250 [Verrucomicrobiota bacterium]|nr:hypothetical protein [Verrucomicrobiota bacterium]